jgi:hypothetical protein
MRNTYEEHSNKIIQFDLFVGLFVYYISIGVVIHSYLFFVQNSNIKNIKTYPQLLTN